jgi:septum formation protein
VSSKELILASASDRRYQLLNQIGCAPDLVIPADVNEARLIGESPRELVTRLAFLKGEKIFRDHKEAVIVAADTTVALGRRVVGKPRDAAEAEAFLTMLSGRNHRVYTSIYIRYGRSNRQRCIQTRVKFKKLTTLEISNYLDSGEWEGKAGGYAIQGKASAFIISIVGSYTNVVGLPLYETYTMLSGVGYPTSD